MGEDNVSHFTGIDVEDIFRTSPQDTLSVTADGQTITPTGAYQPLSVTYPGWATSSITAGTAGDWLYLTNTMTNTLTFTDTGTLKLGDNRAVGQYDSLLLQCDGTNWVEVSFVNN